MSFPAWLRLRSVSAGRLTIVAAALSAYAIAAVGVPLPTFQAKDRSQPFPCMDRPCGCKSASACWTSCCCTTPEERLRWARDYGVEPPDSLLAATSHEAEPDGHSTGACCTSHAPADEEFSLLAACDDAQCDESHGAESHHTETNSARSDCSEHAFCNLTDAEADVDRPAATAEQAPAADEVDFVVIAALRECQGLSPLWSSLSAAIPPPSPIGYEFDWRPVGRVEIASDSAPSSSLSPATPPPRA